jgi:hypothetical protein
MNCKGNFLDIASSICLSRAQIYGLEFSVVIKYIPPLVATELQTPEWKRSRLCSSKYLPCHVLVMIAKLIKQCGEIDCRHLNSTFPNYSGRSQCVLALSSKLIKLMDSAGFINGCYKK